MRSTLLLLLLCLIPFHVMSANTKELATLLPEIPENWKPDGEPRLYYPEQLYDYINGGAELYISYGMNRVISQLLSNENGDEIRVEIFDMNEAKNAFGVFTHTRTSDEKKFGQGSQYFTGAQIFWKNKYPAAAIPQEAKQRGAFLVIINYDETPFDKMADLVIKGSAGKILHELAKLVQKG